MGAALRASLHATVSEKDTKIAESRPLTSSDMDEGHPSKCARHLGTMTELRIQLCTCEPLYDQAAPISIALRHSHELRRVNR